MSNTQPDVDLHSTIINLLRTGVSARKDGLSQTEPSVQRLISEHAEFVVRSFGEALRRHWYGDPFLPPEGGLWANLASEPLGEWRLLQIERRTKRAAALLLENADRFTAPGSSSLPEIIDVPEKTIVYRALWEAFTAPPSQNEPSDQPLLLESGAGHLDFELHFRLAYAEAISSPAAKSLRRHLLARNQESAHLVQKLCLFDMASWRSRHVFGPLAAQSKLPPMPLGFMYIEPNAIPFRERTGEKPLLHYVEELLSGLPRCVVVLGDSGSGKSLSARNLASRWAETNLSSPKPENHRIIFVKCAADFTGTDDDLDTILRRALVRHANELGLGLSLDDPAIVLPPLSSPTTVLIDGLDEVHFGYTDLEHLLKQITQRSRAEWRFLLLSRSGIMNTNPQLAVFPVLQIQHLTIGDLPSQPGGQVAQWIARWNRVSPTTRPIAMQRLAEWDFMVAASMPILLFMLAFTWDEMEAMSEPPRVSDVYETFILRLLRSKRGLESDSPPESADGWQRLARAAARGGFTSEEDGPIEAMLWFLSRLAWEAARLNDVDGLAQFHVDPVLSCSHADRILRNELHMSHPPDIADVITIPVLFAGGGSRILFGHRSFREWLSARYWERQLRVMIDAVTIEDDVEEALYKAHFLEPGDWSFRFLMDMLSAWSKEDRERLFDWAARCVNNERNQRDSRAFFFEDYRSGIRLMALAIGSELDLGCGIGARSPHTLRSILAWFWFRGDARHRVRAKHVRSPGAVLSGLDLSGADLSGADLRKADLRGCKLAGADLSGATLSEANWRGADANGASLMGADLLEADLTSAILSEANLSQANLQGAVLEWADLSGANLARADLNCACLRGADLSGATLAEADLRGAILTGALLMRTWFRGANLSRASALESQREIFMRCGVDSDMLDEMTWLPDESASSDEPAIFH